MTFPFTCKDVFGYQLQVFVSTIPDKKVGTASKFSPPPTFNVDTRVIFYLFVGKNAIFSNIDEGGWVIRDPTQVSQLLLAGIVDLYRVTLCTQSVSSNVTSRCHVRRHFGLFSLYRSSFNSEECFVCWLVLPFRERTNFIQLSKNISLYYIYRFSASGLFLKYS